MSYSINVIDKSKFNNILSETKSCITRLLWNNDSITRLLKYNESNALDESNPITNAIRKEMYFQSSENKRLFLRGYDGETVSETRSEIHINFSSIKPFQASTTKFPYLLINIVVADGINVLSDGISLRHDYLFQELNDTIEGQAVGTVGHIEMISATESVLAKNTHAIWSVIYKIGEIKL